MRSPCVIVLWMSRRCGVLLHVCDDVCLCVLMVWRVCVVCVSSSLVCFVCDVMLFSCCFVFGVYVVFVVCCVAVCCVNGLSCVNLVLMFCCRVCVSLWCECVPCV